LLNISVVCAKLRIPPLICKRTKGTTLVTLSLYFLKEKKPHFAETFSSTLGRTETVVFSKKISP